MAYKIIDIEGIGPVYAQKLEAAGIKTTDDLLKEWGYANRTQQARRGDRHIREADSHMGQPFRPLPHQWRSWSVCGTS